MDSHSHNPNDDSTSPGVANVSGDPSISSISNVGSHLSITDEEIDQRAVEGSYYSDRRMLFEALTKRIPKNEYSLPEYFYRADMIPDVDDFRSMDDSEKTQVLNMAVVDIVYSEGFPAFIDGTPIWGKMPYEDDRAFQAFEHYKELADTMGVRRIDLMAAPLTQHTRPFLIEGSTYYYWVARCKAFDLFRVAAAQKLRERRILTTTDMHFLESEKLLGKVLQYFGKVDEETGEPVWMKDLSPRVAMDMLEKLAKMQRVALGIGTGGQSADDSTAPANANIELVLKTIAQQAADPQANTKSGDNALDMLLNDPDTAMAAQELIVRIGK